MSQDVPSMNPKASKQSDQNYSWTKRTKQMEYKDEPHCNGCMSVTSSDSKVNECLKCQDKFHADCFMKDNYGQFCNKCFLLFEEAKLEILNQIQNSSKKTESDKAKNVRSKSVQKGTMSLKSFYKPRRATQNQFRFDDILEVNESDSDYDPQKVSYSQPVLKKSAQKKKTRRSSSVKVGKSKVKNGGNFKVPKVPDETK